MKARIFLCLLVTLSLGVSAQDITYQEITDQYNFPQGINLFKGTRASPALELFYAVIDLKEDSIAIRPYLLNPSTVPDLTEQVGSYLSINGGFFSGSTSLSSVVYPEEVKAQNIKAVTRNSQSYPVIRSFFGITYDTVPSVDWIYHFGNNIEDVHKFDAPLPYEFDDPDPLPAPQKTDGVPYENLMLGIGGAPILVKNGVPNITYNEEIMWGSGVGLTNNDPRTAVGFTVDKKVIFMVADGRQGQSEGVSLVELADIMISLGCVEALNLDGGGSSQMAVPGSYINTPSETRKVPSILVVTHPDNLNLPRQPLVENIIDTEFPEATVVGGWAESANAGFFGDSPSLISGVGSGENFVRYEPPIVEEALFEIYGWWVSSGNRAKDTPYIINHIGGLDTVRVDQTQNGSSWQFMGRYLLNQNSMLDISNAATAGDFAVADAIKFSNFVESFTIESFKATDDEVVVPHEEPVLINVLANDTTYELSALVVDIIEEPTKGSTFVNEDLTIGFVPDSGLEGTDQLTYQVCYGQDRLFCGQAKVFLTIEAGESPVTGVSTQEHNFEVYPNPAESTLFIKSNNETGPVTVRILDLNGKIIFNKTYLSAASGIEVEVDKMQAGLVILEITNGNVKEMKKISLK